MFLRQRGEGQLRGDAGTSACDDCGFVGKSGHRIFVRVRVKDRSLPRGAEGAGRVY